MFKRDKHQEKLLINTWNDEDFKIRRDQEIKRGLTFAGMGALLLIFWTLIFMFCFKSCAHANTIIIKPLKASWYSNASLKKEGTWKHGETKMANGKRFDENALTCASRQYSLGTMVKVKNIANGKSVVCKVTDRIGKRFANSRIDLSKGCFSKIADLKQGIINVLVTKES